MYERTVNLRIAIVLFALSFLMVLLAGYLVFRASNFDKIEVTGLLSQQCLKEFTELGMTAEVRKSDRAIVFKRAQPAEVQGLVRASSLVIGRCAGFKLTQFCAGEGCPQAGVSFILQPV